MIFVKNSHFVWDPSRQRKMRKKLGNLIQSPKDTLDDMLEQHLEEVQDLLWEKKSEFEELNEISSRTEEGPQNVATGLQSSPLPTAPYASKRFETANAPNALKSPRMPAVGLFAVSPKTSGARTPMKRPPV